MNRAELSYELGRVVLVRDFIGPSGLAELSLGRVVLHPLGYVGPWKHPKSSQTTSTLSFRPFGPLTRHVFKTRAVNVWLVGKFKV